MLTTRKVLFEKLGEVVDTPPDPVGEWTGQVDLETTKGFILSHDDWRPVEGYRYSVREVELPDWLGTAEWVRDSVAWKWFWGLGGDKSWPENWQRKLALGGFSEGQRLAMVKLLNTKKFRSGFRESLRNRLESWLNAEGQHTNPFSRRQWECLLDRYTVREAKQRGEGLYRNRGCGV